MTVGYAAGKADIDNRAGQIVIELRTVMADIRNFKLFLDSQVDADLTGRGYAAADISTLRSAFVDLARLAGVYDGTQTQAAGYDFRTFAKLLTGVA